MKTLMVQGTSSGAGKSTLVTALCRIFSDRGYSVAPFKSQNMSNLSYAGDGFEISRAQAVQAVGARTEIIPEINPILLKPRGDYRSAVYVEGRYLKTMHASAFYDFAKTAGLRTATRALESLREHHDLVIIEGAGSPAEINMQDLDIANMAIARAARSPVILITDIERGGAFASLVGTLSLLEPGDRRLVRGLAFNKFRGDPGILEPGIRMLEERTRRPVLGVLPMLKVRLPSEDSLDAEPDSFSWDRPNLVKLNRQIDRLGRSILAHFDVDRLEAIIR